MTTKNNHTPAPWVAIAPKKRHIHDGHDITNYQVMTEKTRHQLREDGFTHYNKDEDNVDNVNIVSRIFYGDMKTEEAIANAHLIAAAPELLDALEGALWLLEKTFDDNSSLSDAVAYQNALNAIKKAKGIK